MNFSVALCSRNGERYLDAQLRSIVEQSLRPAEVVVSDDASTDGTVGIARSWKDRAERVGVEIRILRRDAPLGITRNFQAALEECRGDLIALADQDDVWDPSRLEVAAEAHLRHPDALLIHADARLVDASGGALGTTLLSALSLTADERRAMASGHPFAAYLRRNLVTGATATLRAELVRRAAPFPVSWLHDEWLAIMGAALGETRVIDRPLIDYRQHGDNQVGVREPTLGYRLGRMLEPRGDRYRLLAERGRVLVDRLIAVGAAPEVVELARGKAGFEERRSRYPARRVARVPAVLRELGRGSYSAYSSQGRLDVVRDLLQPSGASGEVSRP